MTKDYYNYKKCIDDLTLILSIGHFYNYSTKVIEKRISESKYFSCYTNSFFTSESYAPSNIVVKDFFVDTDITENDLNIFYNEYEWIATLYVFIIEKTGFNFETIFCYLPIDVAVEMFKLYHEMDINKAYNFFKEKQSNDSIIKIKTKQYKYSNKELSKETGISSSMIDALKNRKRDIKKLDFQRALLLAKCLHIQNETLLNN